MLSSFIEGTTCLLIWFVRVPHRLINRRGNSHALALAGVRRGSPSIRPFRQHYPERGSSVFACRGGLVKNLALAP